MESQAPPKRRLSIQNVNVNLEELQEEKKISWRLKNSKFFQRWNLLMLFVTVHLSVTIPIRVAFHPNVPMFVDIVDTVMAIFLLVDVVFRLMFFQSNEEMEKYEDEKPKCHLNKHYLKRAFVFDLLASIPWGLIVDLGSLQSIEGIKLIALFRLIHFFEYFAAFEVLLRNYRIVRDVAALRMIRIFAISFILVVSASSFIFELSRHEDINWANAGSIDVLKESSLGRVVWSHHFSIVTLFTVGYGDFYPVNNAEYIVFLYYIFYALVFTSAVVANLASVIDHRDATTRMFKTKHERLRQYMINRDLSTKTRSQVETFMTWLWGMQSGRLDEKILSDLPPSFALEIAEVKRAAVRSLFISQNLNETEFNQLVDTFKDMRLEPKRAMVCIGSTSKELFYVQSGRLSVVDEYENVMGPLFAGDLYGEFSLFKERATSERRTHRVTIESVTYCHLLVLRMVDAVALFKRWNKEFPIVPLEEADVMAVANVIDEASSDEEPSDIIEDNGTKSESKDDPTSSSPFKVPNSPPLSPNSAATFSLTNTGNSNPLAISTPKGDRDSIITESTMNLSEGEKVKLECRPTTAYAASNQVHPIEGKPIQSFNASKHSFGSRFGDGGGSLSISGKFTSRSSHVKPSLLNRKEYRSPMLMAQAQGQSPSSNNNKAPSLRGNLLTSRQLSSRMVTSNAISKWNHVHKSLGQLQKMLKKERKMVSKMESQMEDQPIPSHISIGSHAKGNGQDFRHSRMESKASHAMSHANVLNWKASMMSVGMQQSGKQSFMTLISRIVLGDSHSLLELTPLSKSRAVQVIHTIWSLLLLAGITLVMVTHPLRFAFEDENWEWTHFVDSFVTFLVIFSSSIRFSICIKNDLMSKTSIAIKILLYICVAGCNIFAWANSLDDTAWMGVHLLLTSWCFFLIAGRISALLRLLERIDIHPSFAGLTAIKFFVYVSVFLHFVTCIWARIFDDREDSTYVTNLYFSVVTISTIGYGDIYGTKPAEGFFNDAVIVIGVMLYWSCIAFFATLMNEIDISPHNMEHKQACLQHYLENREVSGGLRDRISDFMDYESSRSKGIDENLVLQEELPADIAASLKQHILRSEIERSPMFRIGERKAALVRALASELCGSMIVQICPANGIISCSSGHPSDEMFLMIKSGGAEIISSDGKLIHRSLDAGDTACTFTSTLPDKMHHVYIVAREISEIWMLREAKFREIGSTYPSSVFKEVCANSYKTMQIFNKRRSSMSRPPNFIRLPRHLVSEDERRRKSAFELAQDVMRLNQFKNKMLSHAKKGGNKYRMPATSQALGEDEPQAKATKTRHGILLPTNKFFRFWHGFMSVVVLLMLTFVTFAASFLSMGHFEEFTDHWYTPAIVVFSIITDIIYIVDIYLQMNKLSVDLGYTTLQTKSEIKAHYKSHGLWMDLLASIPLDWILLVFRLTIGSSPSIRLFMIWRLNRYLKSLNVMKYMKTFQLNIIHSKKPIYRLMRLSISTFLSAHCSACMFHLVGTTDSVKDSGWISVQGLDDASPWTSYVASLYWAVATLTTSGYGDVVPVHEREMILAIVMVLVGGFIYSIIIAELQEIVAQSDITSILHQKQVDEVMQYASYREVSSTTQSDIRRYFRHLWQYQKGEQEKRLLKSLPSSLRDSVVMEQCALGWKFIPIIGKMDLQHARFLTSKVEIQHYGQNELIYENGDPADSLFLLMDGEAEHLDKNQKVLSQIVKDSTFGSKTALLGETQSTTVRVKGTFARVLRLRVKYLKDQLINDPSLLFRFIHHSCDPKALGESCIEQVQKNMKNKKVFKMFDESTVRDDSADGDRFVIKPDSKFSVIWQSIRMMVVVYLVLITALRVGLLSTPFDEVINKDYFNSDNDSITSHSSFYFAIIVDIFLMMDMIFNLFFFACVDTQSQSGKLLLERAAFRKVYLKSSRFGADVVMNLPLCWIMAPFWNNSLLFFTALRLGKLAGFMSLFQIINFVIGKLETKNIFSSRRYFQLIRLLIIIFVTVHLCACGRLVLLSTRNNDQLDGFDSSSLTAIYLQALYWATYSFSTVGYGNYLAETNPERLYAIVIMFMGIFLANSGITALLSAVYSISDTESAKQRRNEDCLLQFVGARNLPLDMQRVVLDVIDYHRSTPSVRKEAKLLSLLSPTLRRKVLEGCVLSIDSINITKKFKPPQLRYLCQHLRSEILLRDTNVAIEGEIPTSIYFILSGKIGVLRRGKQVQTFRRGIVGMQEKKSPSTFMCLEICEAFVVHKKDLEKFDLYLTRPEANSMPAGGARSKNMKRSSISKRVSKYLLNYDSLGELIYDVGYTEGQKHFEEFVFNGLWTSLRSEFNIAEINFDKEIDDPKERSCLFLYYYIHFAYFKVLKEIFIYRQLANASEPISVDELRIKYDRNFDDVIQNSDSETETGTDLVINYDEAQQSIDQKQIPHPPLEATTVYRKFLERLCEPLANGCDDKLGSNNNINIGDVSPTSVDDADSSVVIRIQHTGPSSSLPRLGSVDVSNSGISVGGLSPMTSQRSTHNSSPRSTVIEFARRICKILRRCRMIYDETLPKPGSSPKNSDGGSPTKSTGDSLTHQTSTSTTHTTNTGGSTHFASRPQKSQPNSISKHPSMTALENELLHIEDSLEECFDGPPSDNLFKNVENIFLVQIQLFSLKHFVKSKAYEKLKELCEDM